MAQGHRLIITLDEGSANELARLAHRAGSPMEELASALLARAIDDTDVSSRSATMILDSVDGAYEDALRGLAQAHRGETIPLDEI